MLRRSLLMAPGLLLGQESPTIKVEVNLVNVPFSVRDERGQWVTDLKAEDFDVYEDGVLQRVQFFSRAGDSPVSIAVVADVSGSQEKFLKEHRRDLKNFLKVVLRPKDQAMLVCFGRNVRVVSWLQQDAERLDQRLAEFEKAKSVSHFPMLGEAEVRSGASSFYDAIVNTAPQLKGQAGRRAMLVFSDGEDTSSAHHMLDAIEAAQEAGVTVFGLRYTELQKGVWNSKNKYGRSVMARLALETGGLDFDATEKDLNEGFRQIGEMLRSTYDLAFASSQGERDGTFRKLKVRAKRPGLSVRHKTGYFARP